MSFLEVKNLPTPAIVLDVVGWRQLLNDSDKQIYVEFSISHFND